MSSRESFAEFCLAIFFYRGRHLYLRRNYPMTNPTSTRPVMGDELRAALKAIAEGYPIEVAEDRYILVENPKFRPDDGSSPKLIIDVWAVTRASTPTENEAGIENAAARVCRCAPNVPPQKVQRTPREAISRARSASVTDAKQDETKTQIIKQLERAVSWIDDGKTYEISVLRGLLFHAASFLRRPTPPAHGDELRDGIEAIYQNRQAELPKGCKMKGGGRYASDDTCEHCGLLEGEACKLWSEISDERLAKLRALTSSTPTQTEEEV